VKRAIIPFIMGILVLSTAGFMTLYFHDMATIKQTRAQIATVNNTLSALSTDMQNMRTLMPGVDTDLGASLAQLATAANPAVVRIDITGSGFVGMGSGFIVDQSGYVLTDQHVIANAITIKVTLATGDSYAATVVDSDANRDLVLLKMSSARMDFPVIHLGSASDAAVGDSVLVVGFPLGLELSGAASYSNGIVSALRTINGLQYIQTNAAMNAGNSGGPVIDMQGMLVGMVEGSVTDPNTTVEGLGLAIPVADVLKFIDSGRISCANCHYVA